ncbi:MAG TPA: glucose-6-phosphate isomerase [Clostridiales bacterium]|nr:glucose-6-phosphate isomerase [Clostridiales bacterium]
MFNLVIHNDEEIKSELDRMLWENKEVVKEAQRGEEVFADNQGWLDTEEWADNKSIYRLEMLSKEIRENADVFVLIGVGGSNNGARSVISALQKEGTPEIIYAGNTLSPNALNKILKRLEGKSVYLNAIAKNFETLEPGASFRVFRKYMYEAYGDAAAKRIIVTGTKGSSLERLCEEKGYPFLDFPWNIGGCYTAITNVGLFPMAVAGVNIRELVDGAHNMQKRLHIPELENNIAFQYACLRNLFYQKGYRVEMLASFEPQLRWFYKWWIQLFAESEGKDNKGVFPVASEFSEDLHSVGQFIQDGSPIMFETFLEVLEQQDSLIVEQDALEDGFDYLEGKDFRDINKIAYKATVMAHSRKLPCITIEIGSLDEYHFGQMFYFFQFACYLSCKMMDVNAFDQPGVEAYKEWMFDSLGKR